MNWNEVLGLKAHFGEIFLRTVLVYLAILVGVRVSGRRQLGQMTPFDLVLILLISNSVQNAMVGPDNSLLGGLAAAAVLFVLNGFTSRLTDRFSTLRKALEGDPILLVSGGEFIDSHLQLAQVSREMIEQAAREHGFSKMSDVGTAVLEIDGTISIVPADVKPVRTHRVRHHARVIRPGGN